MKRAFGRIVVTVLTAGGAVALTGQAPASADSVSSSGSSCGGGGYCVEVEYSGTAAPGAGGGGGSAVASVPPVCWYEPWKTPQQALPFIEDEFSQSHYSGIQYIAGWGGQQQYEQAAENAEPGSMWYQLNCSVDMWRDPEVADYAGVALRFDTGGFVPNYTLLLGPGQSPPPPRVDVEVLRDAAYDSMDIPAPDIQRNPEVAGSGQTLVNLDTMFWADAYRDTWDITASVGPVSATVVATADDFVLTSPAGGQTCTYAQFTTAYTGGDAPAGACAFPFSRASTGYPAGYPVQTTATWGATWTGVPAPTAPQGLPPVTTSSTTDVPVGESQAIVRSVD